MASTSCSILCFSCKRRFKTLTSYRKHALIANHTTENDEQISIQFVDNDNIVVQTPSLEHLDRPNESYKKWLASLTERMIEALHPALPGRWIKITDTAVPKENVHYFLHRLKERQGNGSLVPHSLKFVPHRQNPYKTRTMKISYRFHDINIISDVLSDGQIPLQTKASFSGNQVLESPASMTMAERIQQALSDGRSGYRASLEKSQPTSTSAIVCKEKEDRATREVEVIWWPGLLSRSQCEKIEVRFHVLKIDI